MTNTYQLGSDEIKRNYQRNTSLIDLSKVPKDIEEKIIKEYKRSPSKKSKETTKLFYREKTQRVNRKHRILICRKYIIFSEILDSTYKIKQRNKR